VSGRFVIMKIVIVEAKLILILQRMGIIAADQNYNPDFSHLKKNNYNNSRSELF